MVRHSTVCLVWLGTEYFGTVWYAWYGYPAVPSEVASSFHWQQQQLKAAGWVKPDQTFGCLCHQYLHFSSTHIFVRRLEGLEKDFNPIETYLLKNYLHSADNDYKLLFSIWRSKMTTYGGPFTEDYLHWHNPLTEGRQLQKGWSLVSTVIVKLAIIATYWLKALYKQALFPTPLLQGCFFTGPPYFQYQNEKNLRSKRGAFLHWKFREKLVLVGCNLFFILVLKIGRTS